jgi:putative ABC transport system ATP-binding protein
VLDGVDVQLEPGRFVAVMGPSGSGKSTLLHLVAGMARPESGRVVIGDTVVGDLDDAEAALLRRDRIGFVFQSFNLVPVLTARENIALPGRIAGRPARDIAARVDELVSSLGLTPVADQRPALLSGGEQQRVAIARALVLRPELVLADEPTGSLDAVTGAGVLAALRAQQREVGATVLMVTHDPRSAAVADEVLRLEDGVIVDRLVLEGWAPPQGLDGLVEPEERSQLVISWLRGPTRRRRRAPGRAVAASAVEAS